MIDRIVRLMDRVERRLGWEIQARLGQRHRRAGRFDDALEAFQRAEELLVEERGPDDRDVIAAIVMEAYCHASMKNLDEACRHYDRALGKMDKIGEHDTELAHQIRAYVTTVCG